MTLTDHQLVLLDRDVPQDLLFYGYYVDIAWSTTVLMPGSRLPFSLLTDSMKREHCIAFWDDQTDRWIV